MQWFLYLAHFLGGAFIANALPHLGAGILGQPLPSPFASPPFRGLSSPRVNVGWALLNIVFAYLLLAQVGPLELRNWLDAAVCFLGFAGMAFLCSRSFSRLRGGPIR